MTIWRYNTEDHNLINNSVSTPEKLEGLNFLSIEFTQYLPAPINTYYIMIGADDGSLIVYDQ